MLLRHPVRLTVLVATLLLSGAAMAQSPLRVESESRDAAAAFVGTENFMIGRIGRDCMPVLGRMETPQQFVKAWQDRNTKYYVSSIRYMSKRLDEALAEGGAAKRDTVLNAYVTNVQSNGDAAARDWLSRGERKQACERAVATIESGAADITPKIRMFDELEALVSWVQQH
jgi:hypothetical protein